MYGELQEVSDDEEDTETEIGATTCARIGYNECSVPVTFDRVQVSMWFPIEEGHGLPVGLHCPNMRYKNLIETELGRYTELVACCLPLACCLLPPAVEMPARSFAADLSSALAPRGILIYLHGNLTCEFDLLHVFEHLAAAGWLVAAPSLGDSAFNGRQSYLRTGQPEGEYLVLCQHTVDRVVAHLQGVFGELPIGMIGYSIGTYVMRYAPAWKCPMVFISGPAVTDDERCVLPPFGDTAFLQFRGEPGELGVIDHINAQTTKHRCQVGPPWHAHEASNWKSVAIGTSSPPPTQAVKSGRQTTVVVKDVSHSMWLHPKMYSIWSQFGAAHGPGKRPKAEMIAGNLDLAKLLPPTILSFFEEHMQGIST